MSDLLFPPVKASKSEYTEHIVPNYKGTELQVMAGCLDCGARWPVYGKGGPNMCPKCGTLWYERGRERIRFFKVKGDLRHEQG